MDEDAAPDEEADLAPLEARVAKLEDIINNLQGGENIEVVGGIIRCTLPDIRSTT